VSQTFIQKLQDQVAEQARDLISESAFEINATMAKCLEEFQGDGKFKFPIGIKATMEQRADGWDIRATLTFGVRHKREHKGTIIQTEPDMFEGK
jgi:hypothetical protein